MILGVVHGHAGADERRHVEDGKLQWTVLHQQMEIAELRGAGAVFRPELEIIERGIHRGARALVRELAVLHADADGQEGAHGKHSAEREQARIVEGCELAGIPVHAARQAECEKSLRIAGAVYVVEHSDVLLCREGNGQKNRTQRDGGDYASE